MRRRSTITGQNTIAHTPCFADCDSLRCSSPSHSSLVAFFRLFSKLKVGYYVDDGFIPSSPACARAVMEAVEALRKDGHEVVEFKPPRSDSQTNRCTGAVARAEDCSPACVVCSSFRTVQHSGRDRALLLAHHLRRVQDHRQSARRRGVGGLLQGQTISDQAEVASAVAGLSAMCLQRLIDAPAFFRCFRL